VREPGITVLGRRGSIGVRNPGRELPPPPAPCRALSVYALTCQPQCASSKGSAWRTAPYCCKLPTKNSRACNSRCVRLAVATEVLWGEGALNGGARYAGRRGHGGPFVACCRCVLRLARPCRQASGCLLPQGSRWSMSGALFMRAGTRSGRVLLPNRSRAQRDISMPCRPHYQGGLARVGVRRMPA